MFPMVPSYNLPKLYELIKDQLPKPQSLFEAYKEIIPAVIKKSKNPNYYIEVKIPSNWMFNEYNKWLNNIDII